MKKLYFLVFSIVICLFSCKKADELTQFELDYNSSVTIPSSISIGIPFNLVSPDIETNSESKFAVNNTRKDNVNTIVLKDLKLNLISPASSSFKFLKSVEVFIQTSGLPDVRLAWKEDIPDSIGKVLDLNVSDSDIKSYIFQEEFTIRVKTISDEIITSDHEIDVESTVFVDAKLL